MAIKRLKVSSYFPFIASKILPAPAPFPLSPQDAAPPIPSVNLPVSTILVADPHLKLPRSYQWNVALEQALGSSQSLSLTYVGAVGRDLLRATGFFNVNPNFQSIALTTNTATSDYHALQLKFQRRLSRGCKGWPRIPSLGRLILPRRMRATTSTRQARLPTRN